MNNTIDVIDDLDYDYLAHSNQLSAVGDIADEQGFKDGTNNGYDYTYDLNGNMIRDENKDILSIEYNHLNLPTMVEFEVPNKTMQKYIKYTYDATGVKHAKEVREDVSATTSISPSFTYYAGAFIYGQNSFTSPVNLKFISQPEGYIEPVNPNDLNQGFDYVYQFKDHLGNIILSYKDNNGNLEIVEENNYYPYGLEHKGYNNVVNGTHYPFGYNGKEENDELGLEWLDFGARNYDASLGRWMNLDPLAELMRRHSPYNYAFDNPVYFIDPDGRMPIEGIKDSYGNSMSTASVDYSGPLIASTDGKGNDTSALHVDNDANRSKLSENSKINSNNQHGGDEKNKTGVKSAKTVLRNQKL